MKRKDKMVSVFKTKEQEILFSLCAKYTMEHYGDRTLGDEPISEEEEKKCVEEIQRELEEKYPEVAEKLKLEKERSMKLRRF